MNFHHTSVSLYPISLFRLLLNILSLPSVPSVIPNINIYHMSNDIETKYSFYRTTFNQHKSKKFYTSNKIKIFKIQPPVVFAPTVLYLKGGDRSRSMSLNEKNWCKMYDGIRTIILVDRNVDPPMAPMRLAPPSHRTKALCSFSAIVMRSDSKMDSK